MDIYQPQQGKAPRPVLMQIHGGSWTSGQKSDGMSYIDAPVLLERGFVVVSIDYRMAPQFQFPTMIEDTKCAVRYLRANAARYGIDPQRIGVWGNSAGGHLASLLGTADPSAGFDSGQYLEQSSRVQAVVDINGPADLAALLRGATGARVLAFENTPAALQNASPVTYISPDDPPFLILHGDSDATVPLKQSQDFNTKLLAGGVESRLVVIKNASHLFEPVGGDIVPSRAEISRTIADFFAEKLK